MTPTWRLASVGVCLCSDRLKLRERVPRLRQRIVCWGRRLLWRTIMGYLIVFLGGGLGAALRHGVNLAAARLFGMGFPYGTLVINVLGSLAMGLIAEYFALKIGLPQRWRLFLTTGVLGGFTTFSAFSLEAALLYE